MVLRRVRFEKDIVCEFTPPSRKTKINRVIIFASGLPSIPSKKTLMEFYSKKGFWFFFPRYRGTWESGGEFLKDEPTQDIKDVIDGIFKPFTSTHETELGKRTLWNIKDPQIYLLGSSFGGPAVLLLSKDNRVKKVICKSPVVDWKAPSRVERAKVFWPFVKEAFGEAFRFKQSSVGKLYKSSFHNPMRQMGKIDGSKILIFHARDDKTVAYPIVARFAKLTSSQIIRLKTGGHLGSNFLTKPATYKIIKEFIQTYERK